MAVKFQPKPGYLEDDKSAKKEMEAVSEIREEIADIPANPKTGKRKSSITIRLDPEVTEFFQQGGMGWQTRMNEVLLRYVRSRKQG